MPAAPIEVRVSRRFEAPADRVFDAWLDPATVGGWLFATETGRMVRVEIDPRVGGRYLIVDRRGEEDVAHTGEYLEIDRAGPLVFTFGVEKYSENFDRVIVEIAPREAGCELTLVQEMAPEFAEYAERTRAGWAKILEGLARALGEPSNG
ncbi:SRPBCC domain-containing protein [Caulobacter sp. 17J80-11]|uniref:SRPBCC family protein n=1 Tax=Caulobacter sp. 17J80-11 TaxID=2763502 RepID=UPI0016534DFB|nr:SRPBCC family protein [Caulobacter sp. 17J80-11]MBC6982696.1 SRPBCC domain-containing protein [Caulobacter sp. 17J80-11]